MRDIEKKEYVYDGISYFIPDQIADALTKAHCETFDWRKRWKDQHHVHSKEIDYWMARCRKLQSENDELNSDWKVLWNENNELRDKMEGLEIENRDLRQEIHDLLKYGD